MDTNIKNFRAQIAELEKQQKRFKELRKTKYCRIEKTIPSSDAQWKVKENKETLRWMYAAYGLMRGRKFSEIENKVSKDWKEPYHPLAEHTNEIEKYLNLYGYGFKYDYIDVEPAPEEEYPFTEFDRHYKRASDMYYAIEYRTADEKVVRHN